MLIAVQMRRLNESCLSRDLWPSQFEAPRISQSSRLARASSLSLGSGAWPASSQAGISSDGIALLGKWGLMVPAVTINPASNFVRAKSLASASVSNVLVSRGFRRSTKVPLLGTSKVTYQVCFIPDPRGRAGWPFHDDRDR